MNPIHMSKNHENLWRFVNRLFIHGIQILEETNYSDLMLLFLIVLIICLNDVKTNEIV